MWEKPDSLQLKFDGSALGKIVANFQKDKTVKSGSFPKLLNQIKKSEVAKSLKSLKCLGTKTLLYICMSAEIILIIYHIQSILYLFICCSTMMM